MQENEQTKIISLITQAQLSQLETEDINYNNTLVEVLIDELKRPSYSSRAPIDNLLKATNNSIRQFGFLGGIFVEATKMRVIDGWHRSQIWRQMGYKTIPCYLIHCSPEQERKLHLSLNTQAATFNPSEFGIEYEDVTLEDFGFSPEDLTNENFVRRSKFNHSPENESEGMTKFSTNIPIITFDQLKAIKKETDSQSMANTITYLVNNYYEAYQNK